MISSQILHNMGVKYMSKSERDMANSVGDNENKEMRK
jgi:hypothetical protein